MIQWLLDLWPRCGVVGRKGRACTKAWGHRSRHRYQSEIEQALILSIREAKDK